MSTAASMTPLDRIQQSLPSLDALARWSPLLAVFLLYSNAVVVGVNFNGLPGVAALAVPALFAFPIFVAVVLRGEAFWINSPAVWLAAFMLVQFIGVLFAAHPMWAFTVFQDTFMEGFVLYLLVFNAFRSEESLRKAMWLLLAAGLLMGAVVTHQFLTESFDTNYHGFGQIGSTLEVVQEGEDTNVKSRLAGPIGEVNRFAQIMAMLVPLAIVMLPLARTRWGRLAVVVALLFCFIGVALAFSRGTALALGFGIGIMFLMGILKPRHLVPGVLLIAVALAAVPEYAYRVASIVDLKTLAAAEGARGADGSTRGRLTEMMATGLVFADHPLIGAGPGMNLYHSRTYAEKVGGKVRQVRRRGHNLYLALAAEHGIIGVSMWLGVMVTTMGGLLNARRRWLRKRPDRAAIASGLLLMLIVYLATSMFLHAAYVRYFWMVMALGGAAVRLYAVAEAPDPNAAARMFSGLGRALPAHPAQSTR